MFGVGVSPPHCDTAALRVLLHALDDVQVRHRCRCTKQELCGEEEARAVRAAAAGALAQNYIIP